MLVWLTNSGFVFNDYNLGGTDSDINRPNTGSNGDSTQIITSTYDVSYYQTIILNYSC